ncbi:hypothetical protein C9439_03310 [archaeon SCG-AAA382B04]|nr:hypothetical protein C9439_03310 [archaeon SCG-AAA382B04]
MKKILFVLVVLLVGGVAFSGCLGSSSGPGGISIPSNYEKTTTTQEEGVTMTQYVVETGDSS